MLISSSYRRLNKQLHASDPDWGVIAPAWIRAIEDTAKRAKAKSILDYGCGKGLLAESLTGVTNYDPCVPKFSKRPEPADLVVCTATLEHVEPECLEAVLDDIKSLALKQVFFTISTVPSRKSLADGSNPHRIVESGKWWWPHLVKRWVPRHAVSSSKKLFFIGNSR